MLKSKIIFLLYICFSGLMHAVEDPVMLETWRKELANQANVDLSDRGLTNLEAQAIAKALVDNSSLIVLNLSMNNIGDEGGMSIVEALKNNATLQALDLSHNTDIGKKTAAALKNILEANKSLRTLMLNNTQISGAELSDINRLVIRNEKALDR